MKKLRLLILLCVALFSVACSYNELPDNLQPAATLEDKITLNIETRAETYKGEQLDQKYFVTAADLENFVNFRRTESKRSGFSVKEVKSYGFDSSQTLFYILNYDKGWEVVAADKRVQPTLAHGDEGTFTMDTDNEPMKFWMNMLADGVLRKRQVANQALTRAIIPESEKEPIEFWTAITPYSTPQSREAGTYAYVVEIEYNTRINTYGEELATTWGQEYPWNEYCPYVSEDPNDGRSPAGCVAVAGAQALFYLREHFDMQYATAPSYVTCIGNLASIFSRTFNAMSSSVWDYMPVSDSIIPPFNRNYAAMFIAYIGELVGVVYGEDESLADTLNLPENVFEFYGISSNTTNGFDIDIVKQNIIRELPIVIRGKDAMLFGDGHAWVIDQYRTERLETIKYYAIFDSPQTEEYLSTLDKNDAQKRVITTTTLSEDLWMNWGWNGNDNCWCATTPDDWWLEDSEGDSYRFKYYIKMIHDFAIND